MALLARVPWPLQRAMGRALGDALRLVLAQRRRIAARNLELCFPEQHEAERARLLRAHFAALGIGVFEFARAWWGSVGPLRRGIEVEGLEHIQAAREGGRGVIVVSGHFTTLEVCGRLMCDHVPLAGMYRPHAQPAMEWAVRRGRARYAAAMFPKQDVRGAVRHLKRGGLLWYAPDQDPSRGDAVFCRHCLRISPPPMPRPTLRGSWRGSKPWRGPHPSNTCGSTGASSARLMDSRRTGAFKTTRVRPSGAELSPFGELLSLLVQRK
jgi:lauroyl/myristoyl acyltransferase